MPLPLPSPLPAPLPLLAPLPLPLLLLAVAVALAVALTPLLAVAVAVAVFAGAGASAGVALRFHCCSRLKDTAFCPVFPLLSAAEDKPLPLPCRCHRRPRLSQRPLSPAAAQSNIGGVPSAMLVRWRTPARRLS